MQVATYSWEEMLAIQGRAARQWPWHRRLPTLAFRGNAGMGNLRRAVRDAMVAWHMREVALANMSRNSIGSGEGHSSRSSSSSDLGTAVAGSGGGEDAVTGNGTASAAPIFDIILDENIHWSKDLLGLYDHCRSARWICRCFLLGRGTGCLLLCLRHVASAIIVCGILCTCRTPKGK
jgi:hypothetical protein